MYNSNQLKVKFFCKKINKFQIDLIAEWDSKSKIRQIAPFDCWPSKIYIKKFDYKANENEFKLFIKMSLKYFDNIKFFYLILS